MIIAIDGSRIRSGGGIAHLKGIISNYNPTLIGVKKVYLWSISSVQNSIPEYPWLIKVPYEHENSNIFLQIYWQMFRLPALCLKLGVDCLFNLDAGSVARYHTMVTLSQDMLSFEKGQMRQYFFSLRWLRLLVLKYVQISTLRSSKGRIYLTNYTKSRLEEFTGRLNNSTVIPHGIDDFLVVHENTENDSASISVIYVSNIAPYKNQLNVLYAIDKLYSMGHRFDLTIVGGGSESSYKRRVFRVADLLRERGIVINVFGFLDRTEVARLVASTKLFLFASSCENMPVTLLEGMNSRKPILCSSLGPMPEILGTSGIYFDPRNIDSIVKAFLEFKTYTPKEVLQKVNSAESTAQQFKWSITSEKTWLFINNIVYEK